MGMQITPLSMGNTVAVTQADPHKEKRPLLPVEQRAEIGHEAIPLPGNQRSQTFDLEATTSNLERISLAFNRRLRFEVNYESREILVKVIDSETDKVIKELPPEELRRLHNSLKETIGFLFDKTV